MSHYENHPALSGLTLGQTVTYKDQYDPTLLQAVPRQLNRDDLDLHGELPFKGEDLWLGYELSWLNAKGLPQVALAQFRIPCESPNIVESKSFKLYLNSLNQTRFESWDKVQAHLVQDLSQCAGAPVGVSLHTADDTPAFACQHAQGECIDDQDIAIPNFEFSSDYLKDAAGSEIVEESLHSHLLKSNCLITGQPDWASVFIQYKGKKIDREKLLRYLVSFRQHNEFHEQCVERLFMDIYTLCQPDTLTVYARYTRRGGLDINPIRSTEDVIAPQWRTIRQ